jgi:hypothetical protein
MWMCRVCVSLFLNARLPDCLVSDESGTEKKMPTPNQSGTGIRGPSLVLDARMPMEVASTLMLMPSYGKKPFKQLVNSY